MSISKIETTGLTRIRDVAAHPGKHPATRHNRRMVTTKASVSKAESQRERDNRDVAYRAALEGIVLLENDGALPLTPGPVALYGAGGRRTIKGGTGSGEVNERHSVSVEEGLTAAGFTVTTKAWLDDYDSEFVAAEVAYGSEVSKRFRKAGPNALIEVFSNPFRPPSGRPITAQDISASATQTCIYVIARQAGEGGDRKLERDDYHLSHVEQDNLRRCAETYARTIVVLNVGSSFDTNFAREIPGINALVHISQLGTMGGRALADVLIGVVSPSGKLTDTWARSYYDIPFAREFGYLNGDLVDEDYREGIYVGYRYFDTFGVSPAYPFGYGLSYTQFRTSYSDLTLDGTIARVRASVANVGSAPGKEVVQVYVSSPRGGLPKPSQALAGFVKTEALQPGDTQDVSVAIDLRLLASYDELNARFVLDAGEYIVRVGTSGRDNTPSALLVLDKQVIVSTHRNICPLAKRLDELVPPARESEDLTDLPRFEIDSSRFATVDHTYDEPAVPNDPQVDSLIDRLTVEELVHVVAGKGMLFLITGGGTAYFSAPGAGGSTTDSLVDNGVVNVLFADGPAGLRLVRESRQGRGGKLKPIGTPIDMFKYVPTFIQRFLQADPDKGEPRYQFATAFPVENALAQTWNETLLEEVGRAVATEMAEYGISYWLAPGINLHRNPLCGRNFEYYSEDPFLSGKLAAALTRGVQNMEGCYVTLKHFVANEREDNRNKSDSHVSERALRELYLRPFEIAVREARAKSVMTSYNRVNGVYAPNSHDLCTKVLRNEWGFDGVVMTDWGSTGKGLADDAFCLKAGNDLVMPGGGRVRKNLLKGLKEGVITETDLRRCATNVLRSIVHSRLVRETPLATS